MFNLRGYDSPVLAHAAADHLLGQGIPARVFHDIAHAAIPRLGARSGTFTVAIVFEHDREAALRLLEELEASPPRFGDDWEQSAVPDLSLLRPEDQPECPSCGWPLEADASLERCERCGRNVDVVELIVEQHGPEALEPCYAPAGDGVGHDSGHAAGVDAVRRRLGEAGLPCRACGYDLSGLPASGVCPECGTGYDKLRAFRGPEAR